MTPTSFFARPLLCAALAATGCGDNPELLSRVSSLEAEKQRLERELAVLESEADTLHAENRQLRGQVDLLKRRQALDRIGLAEGQDLHATLYTTAGSIRCELFPEKAPLTVVNFVQLAEGTRSWEHPETGQKLRRPLYDGTIFHRVLPGFMVQGGDPQGTGRGGPGYTFADETANGLSFDEPGLMAMANRGPDTNGSQFFITDRATPHHLDGKHTIFGKCSNPDVVQRIAEVPKDEAGKPLDPVVLRKVVIQRGG